MSRLVIPHPLFQRLSENLSSVERETAAVLWGSAVSLRGRPVRMVAFEMNAVPDSAYVIRTATQIQLKPEFVVSLSHRARTTGDSIIFVHSHAGAPAFFSTIDQSGEDLLSTFLRQRTPSTVHATMVYSPSGCVAKVLGTPQELRVFSCGTDLRAHSGPSKDMDGQTRFDRQIRAFGAEGQAILRSIRVGIVGAGGTGSVIAQQLAYLGVRSFCLIDDDRVDVTNLNRLVGAEPKDVGRSKVDIVADAIRRAQPEAWVDGIFDSINKRSVAAVLTDCDFVFCCTDSHGSRYVLNQLAYQFLLPVIDVGVVISTEQAPIQMRVRVQALGPELPCHTCTNYLNGDQIRRDLQSESERKSDPYFTGPGEPAPAVVSLNSAACSIAVTMFLSMVTGLPGPRAVQGDLATGQIKPFRAEQNPHCVTCSEFGVFAQGMKWELPGRNE